MSKAPATPEAGANNTVVDLGNGFVIDYADLVAQDAVEEPEEPKTGQPNAVPEGEQVVEPQKAPLPAEPEKPTEPAAPEKPAETPPPPTEPEALEYKIKVRGEEKVVKLTPEQVKARLQMAEDYTIKTQELSAMREKVEPHQHIIDSPAYKEWLAERIQAGDIEAPTPPPPPQPEDVYEYRKRTLDPDYEQVRGLMLEYAVTLPAYEQQILANNHKVFVKEYDRFADMVRRGKQTSSAATLSPAEPAAPASPKVDPETAKKILQSKEVLKKEAVVEKPGMASPEVDPNVENRKRLNQLKRDMRDGKPGAAERLAYWHMHGELPD